MDWNTDPPSNFAGISKPLSAKPPLEQVYSTSAKHGSEGRTPLAQTLCLQKVKQSNSSSFFEFSQQVLTLFGLGFFGVPGPGGLQKPSLHKSKSIDAIDMKLGG